MLGNLLKTFGKKMAYAVVGTAAAGIAELAAAYQPRTPIEGLIVTVALAGVGTGLTALIKRLATWDPAKAQGGK